MLGITGIASPLKHILVVHHNFMKRLLVLLCDLCAFVVQKSTVHFTIPTLTKTPAHADQQHFQRTHP